MGFLMGFLLKAHKNRTKGSCHSSSSLFRSNLFFSFDRFIPFRASNERFHFVPSVETLSPSRQAYGLQLAEALGLNGRVLSFRSRSPPPSPRYDNVQPRRVSRRCIPQGPERKLDAPEIVDDFYLNLLDWGTCNVLAIALGHSVYLWDDSTASVSELMLFDEPVTSVSWAPDASQLAVGLNNAQVQLWDTQAIRRVSTLEGSHQSRVGSLAWNSHILTTGGMDGIIINNDVRIPSPVVATYKGHRQEVCGLKWSPSGNQLASSGCDSLVHIWDRSTTRCLHRLRGHTSAVKALAWCPFKTNLLATADRTLKFWNTETGACFNSLDTAFHVSSLLWSNKERELLSSNGDQLTLWNYPSMDKMAEIAAHTSTVLFMTQSPNDCTVATAAAGEDETLRFWNVFGVPEAVKKRAPRAPPLPFSHLSRIR